MRSPERSQDKGVGRVGVKRLSSSTECDSIPVYEGLSYCDAVRRAGLGETLRVGAGSFAVCKWSPPVLGFKNPATRFEQSLSPRMPFPLDGLLLAPLDAFPGEPEVVIVRASRKIINEMLQRVEPDDLWIEGASKLERSALSLFLDKPDQIRNRLIDTVNRGLSFFNRSAGFHGLTKTLFRSGMVSAGFEVLIKKTLADMSVCRNSTVVPLLFGKANVSFFCTGGIAWGRQDPEQLTSGWPYAIYQKAVNNARL